MKFITKVLAPVAIVFVLLNFLFYAVGKQLDAYKINHTVVLVANSILFAITTFNSWMHFKAAQNANPNVFSRSIMGATAIKLFVLGGAVIVYLIAAGSNRSIYAIFVSMGLYIVYTLLEVQVALKLNKK